MALKVVARKSGLHGRGLFAARDLAAGEKLIEYTGKRYGKGEHPELQDDGVTKFLGLSDGTGIDGTGWAALANHGCDPNCELQEEEGRGGKLRAWLHALRDIRQGEELVWDYCLDVRSRKAAYADWACACGAEECRGTMADPDKIKGAADNKAPSRKNTHAPSPRTRVRRLPDRARYDSASIAAIIDAAPTCTVAFQIDGAVHALPTIHWREGNHLYIHGAKASRMLKALTGGEACVTIACVDGLVLARSAMHHSMNYRSVVIYGRFEPVADAQAKERSLQAFIDGLYPGRWDTLRPISAKELAATTLLRIPLNEASAKVRDAGVKDDVADLDWPVWAGVIPVRATLGKARKEEGVTLDAVPAVRLDRSKKTKSRT